MSHDRRALLESVATQLRSQLSPLVKRLRGRVSDEIAADLVGSGLIDEGFTAGDTESRLFALVAACMRRITSIEKDARAAHDAQLAFEHRWEKARSDEARRELVRERILQTVRDEAERKADLRAVDRHLGREVLAERHEAAQHGRAVRVELLLSFLGHSAESLLLRADEDDLPAVRAALLVREGLPEFLVNRFARGERWQNRLAAGESLTRLFRPLARQGVPLEDAARRALDAAAACANDPDEHPWVRGGALQLLLMLARKDGLAVLEKQLLDAGRRANPRDFLVRRIAVDLASQLPPELGLDLVDALLAAHDPSEHVRMGLCDAIASLSFRGGLNRMRLLAGLESAHDGSREESARVRAAAAIATRNVASIACASPLEHAGPAREVTGIMEVKALEEQSARIARHREETTGEVTVHTRVKVKSGLTRVSGVTRISAVTRPSVTHAPPRRAIPHGPLDPRVGEAFALLVGLLRADRDPMVLEIACEEVSRLFVDLGAAGYEDVVQERAPGVLEVLLRLRASASYPPLVHEAASAAAEGIDREFDETRRLWTDRLREEMARIVPGSNGRIDLATLSDLPGLPADPLFLGRILADLSRRGWGLGATLRSSELRVWRGEHFRTRLWRILHELRAPAPNKRMSVEHTSGRVYPGDLRAHPGWMEEITATVVPGERVFVDHEGGWGRHLPTIDDLLSVLSGKPLRVFSSHGLTTLESHRTIAERLRDYADLSWRYAPLAQLRLSSLGSTEPRERRAYLAHLEERYGLVARFTPYPHPSVEEWERTVSPHLRTLFPHDPSPEPESTAEPALKKRSIG